MIKFATEKNFFFDFDFVVQLLAWSLFFPIFTCFQPSNTFNNKKWLNFVSNQSIDRSIDFVLFLFFFRLHHWHWPFWLIFFNFQRKIMNVFREFKKKKPFFLDWIIVICRTIFLLGCCCRNVECLFWIWKSTWPEKQTLVMIRILVILFFLNQKPNKHKIHTLSNRVFFLLKKFWEKKKIGQSTWICASKND